VDVIGHNYPGVETVSFSLKVPEGVLHDLREFGSFQYHGPTVDQRLGKSSQFFRTVLVLV